MIECRYRPPSQRHSATWLVLLGLLTLAGGIWISLEFEAQVRRVNWAIVSGVCGGAFMLYMFWRWASDSRNTVEPLDLILDPTTNRVSLWRVLIGVAFFAGIWTMGQWVITGAVPTDADKILYLYGTILGSLVAKVASGEWADAKAGRDPIPAATPDSPTAPAAPTPPAIPPPVAADAATEVGQ